MIKEEKLIINNKEFIKRFSDNGKYIKKVGTNEEYAEAVDLIEKNLNTKKLTEILKDQKKN